MSADFSADFPSTGDWEDVTNAMATTRAMVLDFYHVPSGFSVAFKGMVNSFSDQYQSEWNTETVYGRMDPISAFQGTARTISVEWDVVASTVDEAMLNMQKCETLMSMLYPSYTRDGGGGQTSNSINASPLFKFKFGNFAHDAGSGYESIGARAKEAGLTGFIGGFTFEPDFESGIIDGPSSTSRSTTFQPGEFYPQKLTLSAEFTVLHTHDMGWKKGGDQPSWAENIGGGSLGLAQKGYPYNSPGSHQSGFEAVQGAAAEGASGGSVARTRQGAVTEGSDPGDDLSQVEGYELGLI